MVIMQEFRPQRATSATAATALCHLLRELKSIVRKLNDLQFTKRPVGVVASSIGSHVRHCLDHVAALLRSVETGELNYDDRARGTAVESSRFAAIEAIEDLVRQLSGITAEYLDRAILVRVLLFPGSAPTDVQSSFGRELAFVISHTIHHNALVAAMLRTLGIDPPERFGYAPSTLSNQQQAARQCAR